nr:MAG TPA: hypothetical protein [Caudoviricetes sp.]
MYENLFNLIGDLQKVTMKIKIQEVLNTLCEDERVHEILDADIVLEYYEKMHEHFEKNPKDFLFPNREWLRESLDRLGVDLSNVFDKDANVDHIKREEVIILFMLLWIHMLIQNPIRIEVIKDPYDLFYIWTKNRVFIARPTETYYLQDGDHRVLDRLGKSYGWFTGVHHFSIGLKGAVEYMYSSPDDITNINGAYNKTHGSVTKLRSNFKGFSFGRSDKNSVRYMMNWAQDRTDKLLTELADNSLEEKHRSRNIARNTKFVVREMTGMSNKDYKAFLKKFKEKEVMRYDETSQCFEDILKISSLEFDHEVILEAVDVYNRNVYHLNKALLKLKEKLNEE